MDNFDPDIMVETAFNCYEVHRTITSYLSLQDLKSFRLVSKLWGRLAIPSLKEKCLVTLNTPSLFQSYMNFLENQEESRHDLVCLSNYRVILKPDNFFSLQQAILCFTHFWRKWGRYVKELDLIFPWTCCYPILSQIYSSPCPEHGKSCECNEVSLERLLLSLEDNNVVLTESEGNDKNWSLEGNLVEQLDDNTFCFCRTNNALVAFTLNVSIVLSCEKLVFPFSWVSFLSSCPTISHLSIQSDYASVHFYKLINALVRRQVVLKTLKIGTRDQRLFSSEFMKDLTSLIGNQTKTISLGFLPSVKHNSPLDFILRQASNSLKQLTFLQCRTSNEATIISLTASDTTCHFPNLTSFRVTKELVPNLAFLVKMPMLSRLEIYRDSTIGQHDDLSNPVIRTTSLTVVMEHLQSLCLEMFVPLEFVWKLTDWFPNLRRLQIKANDLIARVIFTKWTQLRELFLNAEITRDNNDIIRSALTDEGITGITRQDLQQTQTPNDTTSSDAEQQRGLPMRRMVYIGNLQKLKTCKLQVVPDYQTGLTDYSIYYGLMDVATLKSVYLVKTLVSSTAIDALRQRGVHVSVSQT